MNAEERQKLIAQMKADNDAMQGFENLVVLVAAYAIEVAPLFEQHGDEKRYKAFGIAQDSLATASTAVRKR